MKDDWRLRVDFPDPEGFLDRLRHAEARELADELRGHRLADELRGEGYSVTRTFRYVIAGTDSRGAAVELARRVHGEVEPGGELVYEARPTNPFAFVGALFGGLGE